ncbi:MAG: ABC transporter permease [Bacteroidales bacterium]|nr:ABC transporter permease [Bacteroidales bacterium]
MKEENWDLVIRPRRSIFQIDFKAIWEYRDLLTMFVRRDIVVVYKQTILGPLWFFVQPILTTLIYILVFGRIAGISTDGVPMILFYLSGVIMWNYFSECFNITAKTFTENAGIFGKVYFPRLIMPLSKVISGLIKFGIQFMLFLLIYLYYLLYEGSVRPNINLVLVPYLVILMALLGLGFGIIFTSLTTKYRDLNFLIAFGVQLLMYATPVIYPVSAIPEKYKLYILANPMTPIIEAFKNAFLGSGFCSFGGLIYATIFTAIVFLLGVLIFNKTEQNFIDTV